MSNTDTHLDNLFSADPDLNAAYSQAHDVWISCDPNSAEGRKALVAKQEVRSAMSDQGIAPGQIDADLRANTSREEDAIDLDEIRRELGITDDVLWQPTTAEEVDRIGNKFVALDEEESRIKKQYAKRMKQVTNKRNFLDARYSDALKAYREKEAEGKKRKTVDLPSCSLRSKTIPAHWKVADPKMVELALKEYPPSKLTELNIKPETVLKSNDAYRSVFKEAERRWNMREAAKMQLEITGEVMETEPLIPGLQRVETTESFSIGAP